MDQEKVRQVADQFINQLHRVELGEPDGVHDIVRLFRDDAELVNPLIERTAGSLNGRQDIERFWQQYRNSFREIHSEFTDITTSDHSAGLFWHSTGIDAGGQPLEYDGVTLLVMDEQGKIRHFHGYFDSAQIRHQG